MKNLMIVVTLHLCPVLKSIRLNNQELLTALLASPYKKTPAVFTYSGVTYIVIDK
jgi:hypothetical protein